MNIIVAFKREQHIQIVKLEQFLPNCSNPDSYIKGHFGCSLVYNYFISQLKLYSQMLRLQTLKLFCILLYCTDLDHTTFTASNLKYIYPSGVHLYIIVLCTYLHNTIKSLIVPLKVNLKLYKLHVIKSQSVEFYCQSRIKEFHVVLLFTSKLYCLDFCINENKTKTGGS